MIHNPVIIGALVLTITMIGIIIPTKSNAENKNPNQGIPDGTLGGGSRWQENQKE